MKWPTSLMLIRHGQSAYNALRAKKLKDPEYQRFVEMYEAWDTSHEACRLAKIIQDRYSLGVGDYQTPLTAEGENQAKKTGLSLREQNTDIPDVVFYSPYLRTRETLRLIAEEWSDLKNVPWVEDDRIREQEHGLSLIYNDWRIFHTLHPEQRYLREIQGPYWYQYPQGESVAMVRDRVRSMLTTFIREYRGKKVLLVTHHLTILGLRATLERLTPEEFIELDETNKPVNCGVTTYTGRPDQGSDGKLILNTYNSKLY